jgi:hypothetical protein
MIFVDTRSKKMLWILEFIAMSLSLSATFPSQLSLLCVLHYKPGIMLICLMRESKQKAKKQEEEKEHFFLKNQNNQHFVKP